ncbi:MAG: flagellar motor protein MotB [Treponema sp.]|nr:MAG: flagellar motor protein MotB [Treponema sp.]
MARKKREPLPVTSGWLTTYADMITLMLCFFVMIFDPVEVDAMQLQAMASITGDPTRGGISVSSGQVADLGNTVSSLPSMEKGKNLSTSMKKAVSLFAPEIKTNKIAVTSDERGLVISLASDAFFKQGSAELDIEATRETLLHIAQFLSSDDLAGRKFRIEGHTDSFPVDSDVWKSNWELSTARAVNVLHMLSDFGAQENNFSVAGYADTKPKFSNDTADGRAYNRRVDIIILDEGHF